MAVAEIHVLTAADRARLLLDLASEDATVADRALRSLRTDPVAGWRRFAQDDAARSATRKKLTPSFFRALGRLCERLRTDPERREAALARLLELHGAHPWIVEELRRRFGATEAQRFRALYFARWSRPNELAVYLTHQCNLRCSYCFSLEDMDRDRTYISRDNFVKILDWMRGQPYSSLNLLGGEPTVHPQFADFVRLAGERGLLVHLPTNNLYPANVLDVLRLPTVFNVQVHAMEPDSYSPDQWRRFNGNLEALSTRGIEIWLRYNIYALEQADRWHFLFDLCRRYGLRRVNFALTFPVAGGANVFVPTPEFRAFARRVVDFIRQCRDRDLDPVITKTLPICCFDPEDQPLLIDVCRLQDACLLHENDFSYNVTVRPDLSLDPCIALKWKRGSLLDFKDQQEMGRLFREDVDSLQRKPLFDQCTSCPIYPLDVCTGACLAYKESPRADALAEATAR